VALQGEELPLKIDQQGGGDASTVVEPGKVAQCSGDTLFHRAAVIVTGLYNAKLDTRRVVVRVLLDTRSRECTSHMDAGITDSLARSKIPCEVSTRPDALVRGIVQATVDEARTFRPARGYAALGRD
jgi:hypothetical protein